MQVRQIRLTTWC